MSLSQFRCKQLRRVGPSCWAVKKNTCAFASVAWQICCWTESAYALYHSYRGCLMPHPSHSPLFSYQFLFKLSLRGAVYTPHHTYSSYYYFIIMLYAKIHVFLVSCTNYKYANKIIFFWKARQCKSNKISAQLVQRVEDAQMDILC